MNENVNALGATPWSEESKEAGVTIQYNNKMEHLVNGACLPVDPSKSPHPIIRSPQSHKLVPRWTIRFKHPLSEA